MTTSTNNNRKRGLFLLCLGSAAATLALAAAATAAAPVEGSIAGPVTKVDGATFSVKTTLSPTGSSLVHATSKTTITSQATGRPGDLRKGTCVVAFGTKKGAVVQATRVTLTPKTAIGCGGGFFGGRGIRRTPGATPGQPLNPPADVAPPAGAGQGPPAGGRAFFANAGFVAGTIATAKSKTLKVKGRDGTTTTVALTAKTEISKTVTVKPTAIALKDCVFVRGTSTDKGISVTASDVRVSKPLNGNCTATPRPPGR